jgi:hypothetical protein
MRLWEIVVCYECISHLGDLNAAGRSAVPVEHYAQTVLEEGASLTLIHCCVPSLTNDRDREVSSES